MSKLQRMGLVAAIAVILASCQSYRNGDARTIGEFTDDAAIQSKLKTALIADKEISGWRIDTEVRKGVVTLYGSVASEALREKALAKAKAIKGVVEVEDRLTVVPD